MIFLLMRSAVVEMLLLILYIKTFPYIVRVRVRKVVIVFQKLLIMERHVILTSSLLQALNRT